MRLMLEAFRRCVTVGLHISSSCHARFETHLIGQWSAVITLNAGFSPQPSRDEKLQSPICWRLPSKRHTSHCSLARRRRSDTSGTKRERNVILIWCSEFEDIDYHCVVNHIHHVSAVRHNQFSYAVQGRQNRFKSNAVWVSSGSSRSNSRERRTNRKSRKS